MCLFVTHFERIARYFDEIRRHRWDQCAMSLFLQTYTRIYKCKYIYSFSVFHIRWIDIDLYYILPIYLDIRVVIFDKHQSLS